MRRPGTSVPLQSRIISSAVASALVLTGCADPLSGPSASRTVLMPMTASVANGPAIPLVSNRQRYRVKNPGSSTGRSGSAEVTARALVGKDGRTVLEMSTGGLDAALAPRGAFTKAQVKLLEPGNSSRVVATANYVGLESGYFTATYPDSEAGVSRFFREIRVALKGDGGRFYPCVVHQRSRSQLLASPLVLRIGPGTGHATVLADPDRIDRYIEQHRPAPLTARVVEPSCLAQFPRDYQLLYPATAGVREFYRMPPPRTDAEIASIGRCEAVLTELSATATPAGDRRAAQAGLALGRIRMWAGDHLDPPGMAHPVYATAFRSTMDELSPDRADRGAYVDAHRDECLRLALRLE